MKKPVLVIMAAGMGSRYGGLKQIDKLDDEGYIIMDFSLYDAMRAGFEEAVFIIKKENEELFREVVADRARGGMKISFAFQQLEDVPEGTVVPKDRVKPWGTAHAVFSCRELVDGPFAVINADDYYGREAFSLIYDFLTTHSDEEKYSYAMVGYELEKTVTDNGSVSRGICRVSEEGELLQVTEMSHIEKRNGQIEAAKEEGEAWEVLPGGTIVSMNMWGFTRSLMREIEREFLRFLEKGLEENPLKCEFYLPSVVTRLLEEDKARVTVLKTKEQWYGVTYPQDKPLVARAMKMLKEKGMYPKKLWGGKEE